MSSSSLLRLPLNYNRHRVTRSSVISSNSQLLPIQLLVDARSHGTFAKAENQHSRFSRQKTQSPKLQYSSITILSTFHPSPCTSRYFGSKAGKMGKHLQNLDEMAHEKYRKQKKNNNKQQKNSATPSTDAFTSDQQPIPDFTLHHQEDENDTKFQHGGIDESPKLPTKEDVKQRMMKVVHAMEESFRSIRGAEASPELFDSVQVKAYGSMTPLNVLAQVVISSPTMATITCFDPDTTNAVRDAVRDMPGMNFNPRVEEGTIIVPIPRVSMETRKALVKQIGKVAESTRQRVRRIRRAAQDVVKLGKDGKLGPGISEDDAFRAAKEIDGVTEECIKTLNDVVGKKQESILTD